MDLVTAQNFTFAHCTVVRRQPLIWQPEDLLFF
jgi:hypothetical protein